jgi:hypothetical protein
MRSYGSGSPDDLAVKPDSDKPDGKRIFEQEVSGTDYAKESGAKLICSARLERQRGVLG